MSGVNGLRKLTRFPLSFQFISEEVGQQSRGQFWPMRMAVLRDLCEP